MYKKKTRAGAEELTPPAMRLGLNAYEGFQGGYARGIVRCWERRCCCRYKRRIPPPHLFFSLSHTHTTSPARRWLDDGRRDYFFPRSFFLYFSPHRLRQSVTFSSGGRVQVTFTHGVSRDVAPSSQWRRWREHHATAGAAIFFRCFASRAASIRLLLVFRTHALFGSGGAWRRVF